MLIPRRPVLALASLMLSLATTGATANPANPAVRGGTLVTTVHLGEPNTFDCHATISPSVLWRLAPHYSTLLKVDPQTFPEPKGDLARSWKASPDRLTWEFTLHPNVRFHDGSLLTAQDVRASYERIRNPPPDVVSLNRSLLDDVASITAPNPTTVVFKLKRQNAAILQLLASPFSCVYSAKLLASDPSYPSKKVMGSGPFKFVRYLAGQEWVGERFDAYFKPGLPYLDGFRQLSVAPPAATNALLSGQVHFTMGGLAPNDIARVKATRGEQVKVVGGTQATGLLLWYALNTQRPPLNDVRVRRALTLAMDHWSGSKAMQLMSPFNRVGGLVRPGSPFARGDEALSKMPGFGRDPEAARTEARRLLAEAGQTNLKLTVINARVFSYLGVYLVDQLRQVGVTVDHQAVDAATLFSRRNSGDYDMILDNPQEFLDDPYVQLSYFKPFKDNPRNLARVDDPKALELFEAQSGELDMAARKIRVQTLEDYLFQQAYVIPLFWHTFGRPIAREVGGLDMDLPNNYLKLNYEDIWLATGGRK